MKKMATVFLISGASFVIAMSINKSRFRYDWHDAFKRTAMTLFTGTDWAVGFSEEKFSKIKIGMPLAEVRALLGPPLKEECNETGCGLRYSDQTTGTADYDRRWISTDSSAKVEAIYHEFYID